jgi:hypothetical protein
MNDIRGQLKMAYWTVNPSEQNQWDMEGPLLQHLKSHRDTINANHYY